MADPLLIPIPRMDWALAHSITRRVLPALEAQLATGIPPQERVVLELAELVGNFVEQYHRVLRANSENFYRIRARLWDERRPDELVGPALIRILEVQDALRPTLPIETVLECWSVILDTYTSSDHEVNYVPMLDLTVQAGVIEVAVEEMKRAATPEANRTDVVEFALSCMCSVCLVPHHVQRVLDSGLVELCLTLARNYPMTSHVLSDALVCLTNLTVSPESHAFIKNAGVIELCLPWLDYVRGYHAMGNDAQLNLGLTAMSLMLRTCGKEASCPVHGQEEAVNMLLLVLRQVLQLGPDNVVLGFNWDPSNILLDLHILSLHDDNQSILATDMMFRLLASSLTWNKLRTPRTIKYSLLILKQLWVWSLSNQDCRSLWDLHKRKLLKDVTWILESPNSNRFDVDTFQIASALKALLAPPAGG